MAVFALRGSGLRGGDSLRLGSPADSTATQTISVGTVASGASVGGPSLSVYYDLAVGTVASPAAVYGPVVSSHLTLLLGEVLGRPAVFLPAIVTAPTLTDAQQIVALPGATGGTATLIFDGQTTAPIAWTATASTIQAALVALSNVAPGDVVVTMGPWPAAVVITWGGAYAAQAVPLVIVDATALVGGGSVVTTARPGGQVKPRITVHAMSRSDPNQVLAELTMSHDREWLPELNGTGSGKLTLRGADPAVDSVGYFDLLRFSLDEQVRFTSIVRRRVRRALTAGEEAAQGVDLSGPGVLDVLRDGAVWPYGHPGLGLFGDHRVFNFASLDYDDIGWRTDAVETRSISVDAHNVPIEPGAPFGFPGKWPDIDARWLWDRYTGAGGVPVGDCYFRSLFHLDHPAQVEVWGAADDAYELWVDGELVVSDMTTGVYLGQSANARRFLLPGDHLVAMLARNTTEGLKAGALWSVLELDAAGAILQPLARSSAPNGGTLIQEVTRMVAYPLTPPGFTPGKVLRLLIEEAQGRGACVGVTLGFSDTADSEGEEWPVTADIAFTVGLDLLGVVKQLSESYFDMRMSPQLRLDCWNVLGRTQPVPLVGGAPGANLTELVHDGVV